MVYYYLHTKVGNMQFLSQIGFMWVSQQRPDTMNWIIICRL